MDLDTATSLRRLLDARPVASLATLHRGEPAVSMVPFVLPRGAAHLLIHVSALATHTQDMLAHPRVAVMVMAEPTGEVSPQALPRVSLQADAERLPREGDDYAHAKALYLARFPDAQVTFELPDFAVFRLQPVSARLVAGFGRAHSLVADGLRQWLRGGPP